MSLPNAFLDRPIAHRGLHDVKAGRAENSTKAFAAAIDANYGIELDVQLSSDGHAIVFHDYELSRLTAQSGPVSQHTAEQLTQIALSHDGDNIPTLAQVLTQVDGRVPLLIEIKDQDGAMGPNVGALEKATAHALANYDGPVAVMSFNPNSVAAMADLLPNTPRGIVTSAYSADDWPTIPKPVRAQLRDIPDFDRTDSTFISHEAADLDRARLNELKAAGATILCWTIKSAAQEAKARRVVHNITFEQYLA